MGDGELRILLAAVPGAGATRTMLDEGHRCQTAGTDVVVAGAVGEPGDLEVVGPPSGELDVAAVLARAPDLCLAGDLAGPGGGRSRWEDVQQLCAAGIDVLATVRIGDLASMRDAVQRITGHAPDRSVPDDVVEAAAVVELVDLAPETWSRRRAGRSEQRQGGAGLATLDREQVAALRELALVWLADRSGERPLGAGEAGGRGSWENRERVVVAVTGAPGAEHVIRRAAHIATRVRGRLVGVHVRSPSRARHADDVELDAQRALLEHLGGRFREVVGADIATALLEVARAEHATQIVLGATRRPRWMELTRGSIIREVVREAGQIDVHVISDQSQATPPHPRPPARRQSGHVSRHRRLVGYALGAGGLLALTALLQMLRPDVELSSVLLLYLALVVVATTVGGTGPAVMTTTGAFAISDYYFTEPVGTFTIDSPQVVVALVVFVAVGGTTAWLVHSASLRRAEAAEANAESRALVRVISTLIDAEDPLPDLVSELRATFGLNAVSLLRPLPAGGWAIEAAAGARAPERPEDGVDALELDSGHVLVLAGPRTPAGDQRVLAAYAAQLATAIGARRQRQRAQEIEEEARLNELRASLLAAVSHDLRTPLAAIKASASSLVQEDVTWDRGMVVEFAEGIVDEADRLNTLVGNLLDMTRLETGSVRSSLGPVGLDEIVPNVLRELAVPAERIQVMLPDDLPAVLGDPVLTERVLANLVGNALQWSPTDSVISLRAAAHGDVVDVTVADNGPGIPPDQREAVFQPFYRSGDSHAPHGAGLGLAVARGFARTMDGDVAVLDTAGRGATVLLRLGVAR